jgi:D-alanyl-D-alanine carboxypeptidase
MTGMTRWTTRSNLAYGAALAGALLSVAAPVAAQVPAADAAPRVVVDPSLQSVDSLLAAAYPAAGPGAAVLVARDGQVLLRGAYGMADVELGVPLTPEHVFRIGSITKQFTAVATLLLVDQGALSLGDEITRFFPDWPTHGHGITVEHLLAHTSGIRSYTSMPELQRYSRTGRTLDELIASFRDEPMDFAPGTDWRYNNSGYVLLGAIIEQVSGTSYAEFIRTRLFEPLGMVDTRYEDGRAIVPRRVRGYALEPQTRELLNADFLDMSVPHAAGALVSTVDDLYRWQRAVADGRLLRPATWQRAFRAVPLTDGRSSGYGMGWFIGHAAGAGTVEHGGDINGFAGEGLWVPGAGLHVIVLSNVQRTFANPAQVALAAVERLLGTSTAAPAVALDPAHLDEYVGVYAISETERRTVLREGTTLFSVRGESVPQQLQPLGADEFVYPASGTRAIFERGADGAVSGMRVIPRIGPEQVRAARTAEAPAARQPVVSLPAEVLDRYVGAYQLMPEFSLTVRRNGDVLTAQGTGQTALTLDARSTTRFTAREVAAVIEFQVDEAGAVTGLVLEQGGRRMPATRVR